MSRFSNDAVELIKSAPQKLSNNPCLYCKANLEGFCCGCPKGITYRKVIAQYKAAGTDVLKAADIYKQYAKAKCEMEKSKKVLIDMGLAELCD